MIRELRQKVADELKSMGSEWPVYPYKPDDVNEIPCFVVDRPTLTVDVQHYIFTTSVIVIGRRDGTEDAQSELDETTSWALKMLPGPELAVQRVDPIVATVAEYSYPAYQITVACGVTIC